MGVINERWLLIKEEILKALKITTRCSLAVAVIVAGFWAIWYAINGSVPVVSEIKISELWVYTLPFAVSRWWDIVTIPVLLVASAFGAFLMPLVCEYMKYVYHMGGSRPCYKVDYWDVFPVVIIGFILSAVVIIVHRCDILAVYFRSIEIITLIVFVASAVGGGGWKGIRDTMVIGLCSGIITGLIFGPIHGIVFTVLFVLINVTIIGSVALPIYLVYLIVYWLSTRSAIKTMD